MQLHTLLDAGQWTAPNHTRRHTHKQHTELTNVHSPRPHRLSRSTHSHLPPRTHSMNTQTPLKDIKRGDYIRLKDTDTAPVWVRGDYDKASKTYSLQSCDDISRSIQRKGTVQVFSGFTF